MSKKNADPKIINMSMSELDTVKTRLTDDILTPDDKKIILSILGTYQWLYSQLELAKLGMRKLRNVFGFKTEKRHKKFGKEGEETSGDKTSDAEEVTITDDSASKK